MNATAATARTMRIMDGGDKALGYNSDMYYWLKQPYEYGIYVVCDYSDDVYHVCNGLPSLMKAKKHSFLKFNPYLELVNVTDITETLRNKP